jgi:hypothetical protein
MPPIWPTRYFATAPLTATQNEGCQDRHAPAYSIAESQSLPRHPGGGQAMLLFAASLYDELPIGFPVGGVVDSRPSDGQTPNST